MGYRGKNKKYFTPSGLEVRSGLELAVATYLEEEGIKYEYESITLTWNERYPRAKCNECGSSEIYQQRKYVPDFILGNGVVIETKGRLTSRDRKILAGVRKCNPDVNIKLLFSRDNKISRSSKTRYSEWAESKGFEYAIFDGRVPREWLADVRRRG